MGQKKEQYQFNADMIRERLAQNHSSVSELARITKTSDETMDLSAIRNMQRYFQTRKMPFEMIERIAWELDLSVDSLIYNDDRASGYLDAEDFIFSNYDLDGILTDYAIFISCNYYDHIQHNLTDIKTITDTTFENDTNIFAADLSELLEPIVLSYLSKLHEEREKQSDNEALQDAMKEYSNELNNLLYGDFKLYERNKKIESSALINFLKKKGVTNNDRSKKENRKIHH